MNSTLLLLLPIVLGAIIGYLTNSLAIRMLFRPLKKVYIFGKIPLPFTPGIIPKQQDALAKSIARMVSKNLFQEEVIRRHLRSTGVQKAIQGQIARFFSPQVNTSQNTNQNAQGLHKNRTFRIFAIALIRWFRKGEDTNRSLAKFLSEEQIQAFITLIGSLYIPAVNALLSLLRRKDIHQELARRGEDIVEDILQELDILQRILLAAGQYDKKLKENMPNIIDKILKRLEESLLNSRNREKILLTIESYLRKLSAKGFGDLREKYGLKISILLYRLLRNQPTPNCLKDSRALTILVIETIETGLPQLIEHFNVYQMVVTRISALNPRSVEELLLGIIARHLKYINLFGAIIGGIIGGIQTILSLVQIY